MLHAGQRRSMKSDLAILDLDMFYNKSDRKPPTHGAFRYRQGTAWRRGRQHAAEVPLSSWGLHQRCLGAHKMDTLDHQTFREQCREIIPELHLVQMRHLCALT